MLEYGVDKNLVKRVKAVLRGGRGRRIGERFVCGVCGVVYDSGWIYRAEDADLRICHSCRNKYLAGRMHRAMLCSSPFESNKKRH